MSDILWSPIVGQEFRPPAKAILSALPVDWPLYLQREPQNPAHANAVMVMVNLESASVPMWNQIAKHVEPSVLAQLKAQPRRTLGYLQYSSAEYVAPLILAGYEILFPKLTFSSAGKPKVEFQIGPRKEPF